MKHDMSEDERMTRLAALALGRKVDTWHWDKSHRALYKPQDAHNMTYATFAPLTNHADAYVMEDALLMEVRYVHAATSNGSLITSISVADKRCGSHVFRTVRADESTLVARMAAVTQYAAVCAIMEDADGAEKVLMSSGSRGG